MASVLDISIHASRKGSDKMEIAIVETFFNISIHASREGSDTLARSRRRMHRLFQSTLPAREATLHLLIRKNQIRISIHASREGSDTAFIVRVSAVIQFQSTLPAREATETIVKHLQRNDFNPRFPRGKRLSGIVHLAHPAISIHASREGSDIIITAYFILDFTFQSTLPAREATALHRHVRKVLFISIHASREGSDFIQRIHLLFMDISIHASREGSDRSLLEIYISMQPISIHASREGSDHVTPVSCFPSL